MFLISSQVASKATADASTKADATWRAALAEGRVKAPGELAEFMLGKVSRTFALNIRILPQRLRRQVLLAYLFCRMADTLEDDAELAPAEKVDLLQAFRRIFPPGPDWAGRIEDFASRVPARWRESERWDHLLVFHCRHILPQLREFPASAVAAISACVDEMGLGMIRFTERQAQSIHGTPLIGSLKDLD
ncbi:MAG TPA: squalene/phytoene synthase family protein, partial [Fibrobacteria bacterium]|nr:squalene/phytoene synthase family protein [Fibrobacteria bacterium]